MSFHYEDSLLASRIPALLQRSQTLLQRFQQRFCLRDIGGMTTVFQALNELPLAVDVSPSPGNGAVDPFQIGRGHLSPPLPEYIGDMSPPSLGGSTAAPCVPPSVTALCSGMERPGLLGISFSRGMGLSHFVQKARSVPSMLGACLEDVPPQFGHFISAPVERASLAQCYVREEVPQGQKRCPA